MPEKKAEVPYVEGESPGWVAAVNSWPWHEEKTGHTLLGYYKDGVCLRCNHQIRPDTGLVEAIAPVKTVFERCNCSVAHNSDKSGCGAYGEVEGPNQ